MYTWLYSFANSIQAYISKTMQCYVSVFSHIKSIFQLSSRRALYDPPDPLNSQNAGKRDESYLSKVANT